MYVCMYLLYRILVVSQIEHEIEFGCKNHSETIANGGKIRYNCDSCTTRTADRRSAATHKFAVVRSTCFIVADRSALKILHT